MRKMFSVIVRCSIALLLLGSTASALEAATLKVSSFPSGAQVIVDGVNTGKVTPMNISVTEGDHVVTVQIPGSGWNPDTRTVTIVAGNNDLSVTLLPILTAGPQGPPGTNGTNGTDGTNGTNGTNGIDGTSVTFVDYFSGNQNGCPNGGAIYAAGNPPVNTSVCNGANGVDGKDGMDGIDGKDATRPDGPCFDNVNRYVDCGNGTVTDTVTGLIWLKQADCSTSTIWATANQAAASLKDGDCGLSDNSSPGDWRLPTRDEWAATIARAVALGCTFSGTGGAPTLTDDAGTACFGTGAGSSFTGVGFGSFRWSSSSDETSPNTAALVNLVLGQFLAFPKNSITNTHHRWPVRSGK